MSRLCLEYAPACSGEVSDVWLPGSKSIAARGLILSEIFRRKSGAEVILRNLPDCDDTRELALALTDAGPDYDLGTGGTSLRFFLAYVASLPGFVGRIDCSEALRRRPVGDLVAALRSAGAEIAGVNGDDCPPFNVTGRSLSGQGVTVGMNVSSQYVSALMMASLLWSAPFECSVYEGVSRPYVAMTRRMITEFEEMCGLTLISDYYIEGDWSAASYFYELALLLPGRKIRLHGLRPFGGSLQGDAACEALFVRLGVTTLWKGGVAEISADGHVADQLNEEGVQVDFNLSDTPDLAPALAVGCALSGIGFRFTGVGHLRHKESDRLATLSLELSRLGFCLEEGPDSLAWDGRVNQSVSRGGDVKRFSSHGDHRIAMALAAGVGKLGRIEIEDAGAINKSFPDFALQLRNCGVCAEEAGETA
ncbi:MAG: hypothetical protein K2N88_06930 [Muribaculaceae bacterium]|nr:hypothetical protein [Muribaculaceae bacterium]